MSAALSRIVRPIRFKPKGSSESFPTQSEADVTEHESARETATPLPTALNSVESALDRAEQSPPLLKEDDGTGAPVDLKEVGLTRIILELRQQVVSNGNGEVATQYESSSREQKTGSRLPKGSMVDRKAG